MTLRAHEAYQATLAAQLGENSPVTLRAVVDSGGDSEATVYGWYEEHSYNAEKDSANAVQRRTGARFVCGEIPTDSEMDIYNDLKLYIPDLDVEKTIEYAERDKNGVQVLWLR